MEKSAHALGPLYLVEVHLELNESMSRVYICTYQLSGKAFQFCARGNTRNGAAWQLANNRHIVMEPICTHALAKQMTAALPKLDHEQHGCIYQGTHPTLLSIAGASAQGQDQAHSIRRSLLCGKQVSPCKDICFTSQPSPVHPAATRITWFL